MELWTVIEWSSIDRNCFFSAIHNTGNEFPIRTSQTAKRITLRAETFAGRNFRVFCVFGPFSRKFMPLEISKQQNAKVFSREIIDNFKNAKVFSREKKRYFQANLRQILNSLLSKKSKTHGWILLIHIQSFPFFNLSIHYNNFCLFFSFCHAKHFSNIFISSSTCRSFLLFSILC